jgi:hypothetical protein
MKKSIGILIAMILLFTTTCGLCDDDSSAIAFTAGLTSSVTPDTALEIITDESQRAILTVCLALDFGLSDDGKDYMANNFASFLLNDSYVASDGTFLVVTGYAGGKCLNMFYYPKTNEASYYMADIDMSDSLMDILVKTAAEKLPISYKNDVAQLLQVLEIIKKATGN